MVWFISPKAMASKKGTLSGALRFRASLLISELAGASARGLALVLGLEKGLDALEAQGT